MRSEHRRPLLRPGATVLVYAIFLHLIWGVVFFAWPHPINTTPTSYLTSHLGQIRAGVVLVIASAGASFGFLRPGIKGFFATLPQNGLLLLSGATAILAAANGHYPDGVVRSWAFIFTDQLPAILAACLHCVAMILYHFAVPRGNRRWAG